MTNWLNNLELSAVIPQIEGVEMTSTLWQGRLTLADALNDLRFPFTVAPSDRFPGFFEVRPK